MWSVSPNLVLGVPLKVFLRQRRFKILQTTLDAYERSSKIHSPFSIPFLPSVYLTFCPKKRRFRDLRRANAYWLNNFAMSITTRIFCIINFHISNPHSSSTRKGQKKKFFSLEIFRINLHLCGPELNLLSPRQHFNFLSTI